MKLFNIACLTLSVLLMSGCASTGGHISPDSIARSAGVFASGVGKASIERTTVLPRGNQKALRK